MPPKKNIPTVQLNVDVPAEIAGAVAIYARERGLPQRLVVVAALKKFLKLSSKYGEAE